MVLGDFWSDVSNLNISIYVFRTPHINSIKNEHVKINKTSQDTKGPFKANHSNVMDVLGRLTSKFIKPYTLPLNTIKTHIITSLNHETHI